MQKSKLAAQAATQVRSSFLKLAVFMSQFITLTHMWIYHINSKSFFWSFSCLKSWPPGAWKSSRVSETLEPPELRQVACLDERQ